MSGVLYEQTCLFLLKTSEGLLSQQTVMFNRHMQESKYFIFIKCILNQHN